MTTITAAVESTLARRDADELAALRAELAAEREANAKWHRENECKGADELHCPCVPGLRADLVTAAEVTARLTEERDEAREEHRAYRAKERGEWAEVTAERDALREQLAAAIQQRTAVNESLEQMTALVDGLRAQLARCQTKFGERLINDETNALRAQRDAAVEALENVRGLQVVEMLEHIAEWGRPADGGEQFPNRWYFEDRAPRLRAALALAKGGTR